MKNQISKIIKELNNEFGTDFNEDSPLLEITIKNMKKGKSFEDSFKAAFESILNTQTRLQKGYKRREIAEEYLFQELYKKHGDSYG